MTWYDGTRSVRMECMNTKALGRFGETTFEVGGLEKKWKLRNGMDFGKVRVLNNGYEI